MGQPLKNDNNDCELNFFVKIFRVLNVFTQLIYCKCFWWKQKGVVVYIDGSRAVVV